MQTATQSKSKTDRKLTLEQVLQGLVAEGRNEAAAHQRRDESRRGPHHGGGSAEGDAAHANDIREKLKRRFWLSDWLQ